MEAEWPCGVRRNIRNAQGLKDKAEKPSLPIGNYLPMVGRRVFPDSIIAFTFCETNEIVVFDDEIGNINQMESSRNCKSF